MEPHSQATDPLWNPGNSRGPSRLRTLAGLWLLRNLCRRPSNCEWPLGSILSSDIYPKTWEKGNADRHSQVTRGDIEALRSSNPDFPSLGQAAFLCLPKATRTPMSPAPSWGPWLRSFPTLRSHFYKCWSQRSQLAFSAPMFHYSYITFSRAPERKWKLNCSANCKVLYERVVNGRIR